MKSRTWARFTAMTLFAALATTVQPFAQTSPGKIITFNAPGAGKGAGQGTLANGINSAGTIMGFYLDTNNIFHGYLRAKDGTFTIIDVPGAGKGAFQGTQANSLNADGDITGIYADSNNVSHGYLRAHDGTITKFRVPGAGKGAGQGSQPYDINRAEALA
jgi:hypothetical protein